VGSIEKAQVNPRGQSASRDSQRLSLFADGEYTEGQDNFTERFPNALGCSSGITQREQMMSTLSPESGRRTCPSYVLCGVSPPLSLSLPHKGGGNRVARTFATHETCLQEAVPLALE
jgi:hypothetical protein